MSGSGLLADTPSDGVVLERVRTDSDWPVQTNWRALLTVQGEYRSPEWVVSRVKAVPLSSRAERSLLAAVASDDGRAVLEAASTPGEHHVAAAVIASLRLAGDYPDRAIRFLEWLKTSPDDPGRLRFLRRYLPGIEVLTRAAPGIPLAMPLDRRSLTLLHAELLTNSGTPEAAEALLAELPLSPAVALALASTRLKLGNVAGARAIASGRPVYDGVSAAAAVIGARADAESGDHEKALESITTVLAFTGTPGPATALALEVRATSLRALGRVVEADLTDVELGTRQDRPLRTANESSEMSDATDIDDAPPTGPLFGRSLADAIDDAWARIRRQTRFGTTSEPFTADEVDAFIDDAVALVGRKQFDAAEALLLAQMDRVEDLVDDGGPVVDDFYIVLAGTFNRRGLMPEEIATLDRLRLAHDRAGSATPPEILEQLNELRGTLDALA